MNPVPTFRELEDAGADAGAILDACEAELERSIPMAANKIDRADLAADLKRVRTLRLQWFGGSA